MFGGSGRGGMGEGGSGAELESTGGGDCSCASCESMIERTECEEQVQEAKRDGAANRNLYHRQISLDCLIARD